MACLIFDSVADSGQPAARAALHFDTIHTFTQPKRLPDGL